MYCFAIHVTSLRSDVNSTFSAIYPYRVQIRVSF